MELQDLKNIDSLTYGWRADASDISRFYPGASHLSSPGASATGRAIRKMNFSFPFGTC